MDERLNTVVDYLNRASALRNLDFFFQQDSKNNRILFWFYRSSIAYGFTMNISHHELNEVVDPLDLAERIFEQVIFKLF